MTYIPEKAHWYVAEIVEEITVDGAVDKVIHRNLILIEADSPNQAFERAIELGKRGESSYKNPEGRGVSARFVGLGDLSVVYDELEHGAELMYSEHIVRLEEDVSNLIRPRGELTVFRDAHGPPPGLDYSDRDAIREATALTASNLERNS